jgi:hypothetical protein
VIVSKRVLFALAVFSCLSYGIEGEEKALSRLAMTTDLLLATGEEMVGQAASGTILRGDSLLMDVNLSSEYTYTFIIWTDSAFNIVDFWLTSPEGTTPRGDVSDHTTMAISPDSSEAGVWQMGIELLEGADSDTAYFAAAILKAQRIIQ